MTLGTTMQILVNFAVVIGFTAIMTGSFLARRAISRHAPSVD